MKIKFKELDKIRYFINKLIQNLTTHPAKEVRDMIYAIDIIKCENELTSNIVTISDENKLTSYLSHSKEIINKIEEIMNHRYFTYPQSDDRVYISQIEERLKTLNQVFNNALLALEQPTTQQKDEPQLGRYSNSKLVLIFYYFFKFTGIEPRVNTDIAPIAKFLHLIVGKEYKNITSSDFYQKLRKVPNFKTDKELIKDLNEIKPLFKKVELNEIVRMIDNEIDQARTELKQRK